MYKKILAFLLAILCLAGTTAIGVGATETENVLGKLYFEAPETWGEPRYIYCHIADTHSLESLADWQTRKERCTKNEDGLWEYDLSVVGGIKPDKSYMVIFSSDYNEAQPLHMNDKCIGDTAFYNGIDYESELNSKLFKSGFIWKNQDPKVFGPIMHITWDGKVIGECVPDNEYAESLFKEFLQQKLDDAQDYSGKTDQEIIDNIITPLNISKERADDIITESGVTVDWEGGYGDIVAPKATFTYDVVNGEAILTGCSTKESYVDLPETISGMPVTGISSATFFQHFFYETVVNIPASITNISLPLINYDNSFSAVTELNVHEDNPVYASKDGILYTKDMKTLLSYPPAKSDKVCTVDEGVLNLSENAFYACRFEEILLPDTLENIPAGAFNRCVSLKALNIPASVKNIDATAFEVNRSLAAINVSEDNEAYCSDDGVLYNKDKTTFVMFPVAKNITSYTVPEGVTEIGAHAFQSFSNLKSLSLPESLETIGFRAFFGFAVDFDIPKNVKHIEAEAFQASGITKAIIPEGVTEIKDYTFYACELEEASLPHGLVRIGKGAFNSNQTLKSINIPDSVTEIGENAFTWCTGLDKVTLPRTTTKIGKGAFSDCSEDFTIYGYKGSQAEIYAKEENIHFVDIEGKSELGDVNLDGKVNVKDATAIQKQVAGIIKYEATSLAVADYDGDGKVTVRDATAIQKFVAGIL